MVVVWPNQIYCAPTSPPPKSANEYNCTVSTCSIDCAKIVFNTPSFYYLGGVNYVTDRELHPAEFTRVFVKRVPLQTAEVSLAWQKHQDDARQTKGVLDTINKIIELSTLNERYLKSEPMGNTYGVNVENVISIVRNFKLNSVW